jgi:hypothetical protein
MTQQVIATQICAGAFDTVAQADRAIRQLLAASFSKDQLAVICSAKLKDHFLPEAHQAQTPAADPEGAIAMGGALGATVGGLALAVTVITGGAVGVMTAVVLIGGGAFAGGFSNLIVSKGYEQESDDHYKQAVERGQIVVGVEVHGENGVGQLAKVQRILDEAGAKQLSTPVKTGPR